MEDFHEAVKLCATIIPVHVCLVFLFIYHPLLVKSIFDKKKVISHLTLGEANAGSPASYLCTFPTMIDDWRQKFHTANSQNDPLFPFGFVQVRTCNVEEEQFMHLYLYLYLNFEVSVVCVI